MNVGRLAGVIMPPGAQNGTAHQRFAEYLRPLLEQYPGRGMSPALEWTGEQTVRALMALLGTWTDDEMRYDAIKQFLDYAAEEVPGMP